MRTWNMTRNAVFAMASASILLSTTASPVWADSDKVAGKTYGEWSGRWWQWASANDGAFDDGLIDCSAGQNGPVWFLAGKIEDDCCDPPPGEQEADRMCQDPIPAGKRLFIPLVNAEISNPDSWCPPEEPDDLDDENNICTVQEKREILNAIFSDFVPGILNSRACFLSASVDGTPVIHDGTLIVRTQSPAYSFEDDPETVADGFYVMLPKLPKGKHTIDFSGAICDFEGTNESILFGLQVRYELTIGDD